MTVNLSGIKDFKKDFELSEFKNLEIIKKLS